MSRNSDGTEPAAKRPSLLESFLKYRRLLRRIAGRIVGPADVEDVLQETYLRCCEADKKERIRHPAAFMRRTTTNIALNYVNSAAHRLTSRIPDSFALDVIQEESLENQAATDEQFAGFCRAVKELPAVCRQVFILKKVYGLSQREIAVSLDISESTVEKHVAKGLMRCSEAMLRMGHDMDSGMSSKSARASRRRRKNRMP